MWNANKIKQRILESEDKVDGLSSTLRKMQTCSRLQLSRDFVLPVVIHEINLFNLSWQ